MKRKSNPWPIIAAIVLGILCIFLFFTILSKRDQEAKDHEEKTRADLQKQIDALTGQLNQPKPTTETVAPTHTRKVLFAAHHIDPNAKINPDDIKVIDTPLDIAVNAYVEADQKTIIGYYALRSIETGDYLGVSNVGPAVVKLSDRIPVGMRTLSIPVDLARNSDRTGGFVVDGDYVDLVLIRPDNASTGSVSVETVMQNLQVFYIPALQDSQRNKVLEGIKPTGDAVSVTFLVTPEQAESLTALQNIPNVRFAMLLRATKDREIIRLRPVVSGDLLENLSKVQSDMIRSQKRVQTLAQLIADKEKAQGKSDATTKPAN